jgi:hypothetical protein
MNEECSRSSGVGPKDSDDEVRKERRRGLLARTEGGERSFVRAILGLAGMMRLARSASNLS